MSGETSNDLLYELGCDCEDLFDQLHLASTTAKSNKSLIQLFVDFQRRFAIWAAHFGVFAPPSQSLDRRLHQCLNDMCSRKEGHVDALNTVVDNSEPPSEPEVEALQLIDDTLTRLIRLGVTIRQSSSGKVDARAKIFAQGHDLSSFASLCSAAVQCLYPAAHPSLKEYLSKSMTDRYARMLFLDSRQKKLNTRRRLDTEIRPVPELHEMQQPSQLPESPAHVRNLCLRNLRRNSVAPSLSDMSSVDTQRIKARLKPPDEPSVKSRTMSIREHQGIYPEPPNTNENSKIFTCEWCSEMIVRDSLSESDWRRHTDRDLKPYICLSESCPDEHPAYPTLDDWVEHMSLHSRRWHQQVYLTSTWICTICECNTNVYHNSKALYEHLVKSHRADFTIPQLQVISRQSKTEKSRAWDDCLLCGFTSEEHSHQEVESRKRRKRDPKKGACKDARTTFEMAYPNPRTFTNEDSDTSSDSDATLVPTGRNQADERSKPITRHIAAHLQVLMFLTLRFAALQNDEVAPDVDTNSESTDMNENNSAAEGKDWSQSSESSPDVETISETEEEVEEGDSMDLDNDVMIDGTPVPDADIDLTHITRQYDGLSTENDHFLKRLIESGAYQSSKARSTTVESSHWEFVSDLLLDDNIQFRPLLEESRHNGTTALSFCAEFGLLGILGFLLHHGADPGEASQDSRRTPLHLVIINEHGWIAVAGKAERSKTHFGGNASLVGADTHSMNGSGSGKSLLALEIITMLLDHGAEVNAADCNGSTPLILASYFGKEDVVQLLLRRGADIHIADNKGLTSLMVACKLGRETTVKLLLGSGADINAVSNGGWTALTVASMFGNRGLMLLLLQNGAYVEAGNMKEWSPLLVVSGYDKSHAARILLDNGAIVDATTGTGCTPLIRASERGILAMVELLIRRGADVNAADIEGQTSLMLAARYGGLDVAKLLLDSGAGINAATNEGQTPLIFASANGGLDVVELMLEKGADINAADNRGRTSLMLASTSEGADVVKLLLDRGADINAADARGQTSLMFALRREGRDVVELLIEKGANVNAADHDGERLCFLLAVPERRLEVLRLLLKKVWISILLQNCDGCLCFSLHSLETKV
ncbi:Ankyrin repeat domain-containing protein [Paramyrothecium foliicola]|nr:Ankyrin repeat domain-containing protein [Paramyrothecium foliicola]